MRASLASHSKQHGTSEEELQLTLEVNLYLNVFEGSFFRKRFGTFSTRYTRYLTNGAWNVTTVIVMMLHVLRVLHDVSSWRETELLYNTFSIFNP